MAAKQKKYGLGRVLNALLPVDDESSLYSAEEERKISEQHHKEEQLIPLEKLRTHPHQPRRCFDSEGLQELADSIRQHGIIQPLIVEEAGDGTYTIVAGERRSRAAAQAGLTEAPVLVRHYTDEKRLEVSLIENIQRTDLNPIEEAAAYKRLMELTGLSQEEAAAKVGKKRSTVANALRLLKLPAAIQESLETGMLSPGHARALLSMGEPVQQEKLFQKILSEGISVREAEKYAAAFNRAEEKQGFEKRTDSAGSKQEPELQSMEEKFIELLGTKVTIQGNFHKGSIRIDYYSMEDLDRLYEILKGP
ncbi:MAG: ParB/RepB/Spo0J family partition protein [Treponema sp.]|jgi:ParB family chromosome partitioning protein|nr:ParB/RepB/Spo0J family partition protein [Treponema sp.]